MPQWKPPTDTNLPAVSPPGTTLSPHQRWVAKQLSEMPELSPRQQAWLDQTRRNQKGAATDPRETVPKANTDQAAAAANRIGLSGLGDSPISAPRPIGHGRPPLPSQTPESAHPPASTTRQNSMGVRRRRKITEEEEEEFDANSQANHPAENPPQPPPPPPPDSYDAGMFGDDDSDDSDEDDIEEEEEEDEPDEVLRPRDRNYPPPRALQPYDARTDVMIEKFGQVANQMIFVTKENNFMAQQSAAESRKAADMIRENANSMMKMMQEASSEMMRTFQENTTKMMDISVRMVQQADARRDAAEASQIRAMETYQTALTREAEAQIAIAQAARDTENAEAALEMAGNQPAAPEAPAEENETESMISSFIGKGVANAAGPIVDQLVAGVMNGLGVNGPKLNEDMVKNIVESTVKSTISGMRDARRKSQEAAQNPTPPQTPTKP